MRSAQRAVDASLREDAPLIAEDGAVNEQIQMTFANVQDMAKNLDGYTQKYVEAWSNLIDKRRYDLMELERVKEMLSKD